MKKYIVISGLYLKARNRGTAALGYGAFHFLKEKGFLHDSQEILELQFVRKPWKFVDKRDKLNIQGHDYYINTVYIPSFESFLQRNFNFVIPLSKLWRITRKIEIVANINGGDGFSDIYGTPAYMERLTETSIAMTCGIPIIILPQTIGPFYNQSNRRLAEKILRYANRVYVRDKKFVEELMKLGIQYELEKDLSAFMQPETWDIDIKPNSVGVNVSGLCYSNTFRALAGQFEYYPELIDRLISYFQKEGRTIYLIPHSYDYNKAEESNDDMVACREAYNRLSDKSNVILVDKDLISPQVKYVISKMSFFCGTRMHANFAAIYSHVPVFGLAYSYKFEGAFNANGLDGSAQTAMVNNIKREDIDGIIEKIDVFYKKVFSKKDNCQI